VKKSIPIKVMTRLPRYQETYHRLKIHELCIFDLEFNGTSHNKDEIEEAYCNEENLEVDGYGYIFNVRWINK